MSSIAACSASSNGGGAGHDAGPTDGAPTDDATADATPPPSCPATAPGDGSMCAPQGLACEYGQGAVPTCDTMATCNGGRWQVVSPSTDPTQCPASLATGCPTSFGAVHIGQHCEPLDLNCDYTQGRCACSVRSGPTVYDAAAQAGWICPSPDTGCPLPRPRLGAACTGATECDYGACAIPGAIAERCDGSVWIDAAVACPQ